MTDLSRTVNEAARHPCFRALADMPSAFPGMDQVVPDLAYLMGCGSFKQFCATLGGILIPDRFCRFCNPELKKYPPESTCKRWHLAKNDYAKQNMTMLLIYPHRHLLNDTELEPEDWLSIGCLYQEAKFIFDIPGGGLIARFGDPRYHAGTMPHFHINLISPNPEEEYRAPLSKNRPDREENWKRLLAHRKELMNERGGLTWLFSDEGIEYTKS